MQAAPRPQPAGAELWSLLACGALAVPMLVAYNLPPSATFFNQAAAFFGWGSWLALASVGLRGRSFVAGTGLVALLAAFALLAVAALASPLWTGLPWALALSPAGAIAAAAWVAWVAAGLGREGLAPQAFRALCIGLVAAGLANSVVGLVQVYAPGAADGGWIAHSTIGGRAVGNLRQPNHLSSLLLWAIIAVLWLGQAQVLARGVAIGLAAVMLFVVVLTASRTGMLGAALLALWGALDRRLARPMRIALVVAPLAYAAMFQGASLWAHQTEQVFGGEGRLSGGDISSSRFGIWSNTLALIAAHPWTGVGFGEFNFAWTLTPFPGRPVAFFDHTHNLPLQFVVELGLPLGLAVLALLALALALAAERARDADGDDATVLRAALAMVVMIALHSLLEYPLWYAYFLFPAAFAFGLCLASPEPDARAEDRPLVPALIVSLLVLAGGAAALRDYMGVVAIFAPPDDAAPLAERIVAGQRSWFFSHHADYAAGTTPEHPSQAMEAFDGAPHYLLDARLLMAWARALDEAGHTERAIYLAQRLREFRNEQSEAFFEPCDAAPADDPTLPFQCRSEHSAGLGYEDFRRRR